MQRNNNKGASKIMNERKEKNAHTSANNVNIYLNLLRFFCCFLLYFHFSNCLLFKLSYGKENFKVKFQVISNFLYLNEIYDLELIKVNFFN